MLEYICYGCIGTYYFSFCAFAGYTCYQERREESEARIREYQQINQQNPPNIEMMPERQFSRLHSLDTIVEDVEESF